MVQVGPAAGVPTAFRFVEWGSVIAGAVTAAALSFVFLTFGSAIGLSAVSPWPDAGVSAKTAASLAVFWTLAMYFWERPEGASGVIIEKYMC